MLIGQGTLVFSLVVMVAVLSFIFVFNNKLTKKYNLVNYIKKKVMWSSVFRSQIQFYFPSCLITFSSLMEVDPSNYKTFPGFLIKFLCLLFLPVFSFCFLSKESNFTKVHDIEFKSKWGTLYSNTNTKKAWTSQRMLSIFCIRRLLVGVCTVYFAKHPILSIYMQGFFSLILISLHSSI